MANIPRKSDGRRIFTDKFKREQLARLARGEVTVAQLSRKLGIAPSLLHRWKRLMPGVAIAGPTRNRLIPATEPRTTAYIRELQQLLGRQTVELELLRTELEVLKKARRLQRASGR